MMKKKSSEGTSKLERKTVEKNRRVHMKALCFKLSSLIPKESVSKDSQTQQDHLDQATSYINELRGKIEQLKTKRELGKNIEGINRDMSDGMMMGVRLPVVEIRELDSTLEVLLICSASNKQQSVFHQVITVLEEEGAEVINASFCAAGDKIFYTIHSQVTCPRIGLEASRVSERLHELVR